MELQDECPRKFGYRETVSFIAAWNSFHCLENCLEFGLEEYCLQLHELVIFSKKEMKGAECFQLNPQNIKFEMHEMYILM